jgi:mannose-6-phosphate isomerase-like protein (cupin superfamily)
MIVPEQAPTPCPSLARRLTSTIGELADEQAVPSTMACRKLVAPVMTPHAGRGGAWIRVTLVPRNLGDRGQSHDSSGRRSLAAGEGHDGAAPIGSEKAPTMTMNERPNYNINLDVKYGFLELVDVPGLVAACKEPWFNQTLCQVNDCVVRLGVIQGEFHWHKHDQEDEFFLVLQGRLLIDLDSGTTELEPHQGYAVPKGVVHRTRAPERTAILMVERSSVKPTGD